MVMEIVISLIILLVGIAVLVSIHFCVVGRAFGTDNSNNNDGETQQGYNNSMKGGGGGGGDDLKNLPCFDYEEPEKGNNNLVDCAVCLESFKVGDACRLLLNCSHSFHVHCIDSWIIKTPFCPICRTCVHQTHLPLPRTVEIEMP